MPAVAVAALVALGKVGGFTRGESVVSVLAAAQLLLVGIGSFDRGRPGTCRIVAILGMLHRHTERSSASRNLVYVVERGIQRQVPHITFRDDVYGISRPHSECPAQAQVNVRPCVNASSAHGTGKFVHSAAKRDSRCNAANIDNVHDDAWLQDATWAVKTTTLHDNACSTGQVEARKVTLANPSDSLSLSLSVCLSLSLSLSLPLSLCFSLSLLSLHARTGAQAYVDAHSFVSFSLALKSPSL